MICPNGTTPVSKLREMIYSKEYDVWFEPNDQPADRDTVILYYYITHTHKTQANKA